MSSAPAEPQVLDALSDTEPLRVLRRVLLRDRHVFSAEDMDLVHGAGDWLEAWPETFAVVGYELSRTLLRDQRFGVEDSASFARRLPQWQEHPAARSFMRELLSVNGATHGRLRETLSQPFVPPGSTRMFEIVSSVVEECLAPATEALRKGRAVQAEELCALVPLLSIGRLLGLPDSLAQFMAVRVDVFSDLLRCNFRSRRKLAAADRAVQEMQNALREVMARDDLVVDGLIAELCRRQPELPEALDEEGLLANVILLYSAGFDTTRSLLSHAISTLAHEEGVLADLRAEPALLIRFIREIERLHPPIPLTTRMCSSEVTVAGCTFPAGSHVLVFIDAANRDPAVPGREDPHRLCYRAPSSRSISFGAGARTCLGLPMARELSEVALRHVVEHWPDIAPAGPAAGGEQRPGHSPATGSFAAPSVVTRSQPQHHEGR